MKNRIKKKFQDSEWFNATTLAERADAFEDSEKKNSKKFNNPVLANRNWVKWKNKHSYMNEEMFSQRLFLDNLDEKKLRYILGQTSSELQKQFSARPEWLVELETAFSNAIDESRKTNKPINEQNLNRAGFETLFAPVIAQGRKRFSKGVKKLSTIYQTVPFTSTNIELLFLEKLLQSLAFITHKTLALEVNVARLQEVLKGDTPEERYKYFVNRFDDPEVSLRILKEYSVLARQAVIHINKWVDTSLEFLARLCKDWKEICETLNAGKSLGLLEHLDIGAGDSHRGGRSVIIVSFDSGIKLVYVNQ